MRLAPSVALGLGLLCGPALLAHAARARSARRPQHFILHRDVTRGCLAPAAWPPADPRQRKKQRRKASKQQLLAEAEAKTAAAAGLAASAEGKAALEKEAWGAALQRAKGEKVLDDPRLLRKSIKKARAGAVCRPSRWAAGGRAGRHGSWDLALGIDARVAPQHCLASASSAARPPSRHINCLPAAATPPCPRPPQEAKIKAKKSQAWQERLKQQTEQQQAKQQK